MASFQTKKFKKSPKKAEKFIETKKAFGWELESHEGKKIVMKRDKSNKFFKRFKKLEKQYKKVNKVFPFVGVISCFIGGIVLAVYFYLDKILGLFGITDPTVLTVLDLVNTFKLIIFAPIVAAFYFFGGFLIVVFFILLINRKRFSKALVLEGNRLSGVVIDRPYPNNIEPATSETGRIKETIVKK